MLLGVFLIMFKFRLYCLLLIIPGIVQFSIAQDTYTTPSRTPEQEAAFLTEKMKKDLQLTPEQSKIIYEINLRYARERKVETSRIQALERVRLKEAEIQQILTNDQISRMQERRVNRNPSASPSDSREYTTQPQYRQPQQNSNPNQYYDRNVQAPSYYRADRQPRIPVDRGSATDNTARSQPSAPSGNQPRAAAPANSGNQQGSMMPSGAGSQPRGVPHASSGSQSSGNRSSTGPERTGSSGSGGSRR